MNKNIQLKEIIEYKNNFYIKIISSMKIRIKRTQEDRECSIGIIG
jgi:hypothetical protein